VERYSGYREFGRLHVPTHVEVAWVVDGVEFPYARFDVTAIEYNVAGWGATDSGHPRDGLGTIKFLSNYTAVTSQVSGFR
jgi:hypothetical protein